MKSKTVLPFPCSFRLTLWSYWNMSARYAKRKIKWLVLRLDTILFSPWSPSIDFNCYILLDACIWVYYHTFWIWRNMFGNSNHADRWKAGQKPCDTIYCVGSDISGSRELLQTPISESEHIKMRNGAMAHLKPPVAHQWAMAHRLGTTVLGHYSVQIGYQREQNYTEIVIKHVF